MKATLTTRLFTVFLFSAAVPSILFSAEVLKEDRPVFIRRVMQSNLENLNELLDECRKRANDSYVKELEKLLIDGKDNINYVDPQGNTLLLYAVKNNNGEVSKRFIKHNADVNQTDRWGCSPLLYATKNNNPEILRTLIEFNADVNKSDDFDNSPLLEVARKYSQKSPFSHPEAENNLEIIELLVKSKADVNGKDQFGDSVLSLASLYGNEFIVKLLLDNRADPNGVSGGSLPLLAAVQKNYHEVVKLLVRYEADVNKKSELGCTVLKSAYDFYNLYMIKLLLQLGSSTRFS